MFQRGFNCFPINRQVDNDRVGVCLRCGDGIVAGGAGGFIPRQYAVTHIDFANRNTILIGGIERPVSADQFVITALLSRSTSPGSQKISTVQP